MRSTIVAAALLAALLLPGCLMEANPDYKAPGSGGDAQGEGEGHDPIKDPAQYKPFGGTCRPGTLLSCCCPGVSSGGVAECDESGHWWHCFCVEAIPEGGVCLPGNLRQCPGGGERCGPDGQWEGCLLSAEYAECTIADFPPVRMCYRDDGAGAGRAQCFGEGFWSGCVCGH